MWDVAGSGGDASWDSDRRIDRVNPTRTPLNMESNAHTPAEGGEEVAIKANDPYSAFPERAMTEVYNSNLNDLDYTPALFNLRRTKRCRVESFVALFILLVTLMGCIFALVTSIFSYRSPTAVVRVDCLNVWGRTSFGLSRRYSNHELFCPNFFMKSDSYAGLYIITVFAVIVGCCFSMLSIICGRVFLCTYFVHSLLALSWVFVLGALIMAVIMYREKLCRNMSLREVGFKLGPAFGVTAGLLSFLTFALIVVVVLAVKYRNTYR
ncbi:hypothetical protein LSCM1_03132 [Leishmania martiniquensis]|uniref:Amastin-like protein n=1 Tax=Leishmania martiniquensis TaxID=1580590 RepID=A0A836KIR2_9TRYP|nr:hypothetical protein LSCM1_03132 [Leishmania martiniquensis]